jgi:hypothetical protein
VVRVPGYRTEICVSYQVRTEFIYICYGEESRPHLWSSGQSFWLQSEFLVTDREVQIRFSALPDFLRSNGSGTGSTQPHDYNRRGTWEKNSGSGLEIENTAMGIHCAGHGIPSVSKSWH